MYEARARFFWADDSEMPGYVFDGICWKVGEFISCWEGPIGRAEFGAVALWLGPVSYLPEDLYD